MVYLFLATILHTLRQKDVLDHPVMSKSAIFSHLHTVLQGENARPFVPGHTLVSCYPSLYVWCHLILHDEYEIIAEASTGKCVAAHVISFSVHTPHRRRCASGVSGLHISWYKWCARPSLSISQMYIRGDDGIKRYGTGIERLCCRDCGR